MQVLAAFGLAGGLLASGCSSQSSAGGRPGQDREPLRPEKGGVFRVITETPASLDPVRSESVYEALPVNQLFDGLVELDPSLQVIPGLADTWTITDDGKIYRFHLRENVRFHDGTLLTASDVAFTLRRLLRPDEDAYSLARSYVMAIAGAAEFASGESPDLGGVRVLDPHTIEIELLYPSLYFLEVLSMDGLKIVPRKVLEEVGDEGFGRQPVGTGPFRFARWTAEGLDLDANPAYFKGAPYLERLHISFLGTEDHLDYGVGRFMNGDLSMVEPGTDSVPDLTRDPAFQLRTYQELALAFIGMGTSLPPLDRLEVRQAIAHAIDREALAADSPSVRRTATGLVPPGMSAYSPEPKALEYDPERSRDLLRSIGYGPGNPLPPITMLVVARSRSAILTQKRIQEDLASVGIRLELQQVTWAELGEAIETHRAPLFLLAWIADLPDPDVFLRGLFAPGGVDNYFSYEDEQVAELLEEGVRERNPMKRTRIYRRLEKRILSRAPVVPLYHTMGVLALQGNVRGFAPSPLGISTVPLEKVWFAGEGAR